MENAQSSRVSRRRILVAATVVMGIAGTYQFFWSSIRAPVGARFAASETGLGAVFSLFVVCQATSQFPAGRVRDRHGPRVPLSVAALLLCVGYAGTALAPTLPLVALAYAVGGVGAGTAYTVAVNTPVKWFTEHRGLATGIVTMASSGFSFLFIPVLRFGIGVNARSTLVLTGVLAGVTTLGLVAVLRDPVDGAADGTADDGTDSADDGPEAADTGVDTRDDGNDSADAGNDTADAGVDTADGGNDTADDENDSADDGNDSADDGPGTADCDGSDTDGERARPAVAADVGRISWRRVVGTYQFWVLYVAFVLANGVGLMVIGSVVEFSTALGLSAGVATASASVVALADAIGVGVGGYLGDRFGYVRTVVAVLTLCGLSLAAAVASGTAGLPVAFVVALAASSFFRGPVFSIFPVIVANYYGTSQSSQHYAMLYSGKLWGGLFGGVVTGALVTAMGWRATYGLGAVLVAAGGVVLLTLRPPRLSSTTAAE